MPILTGLITEEGATLDLAIEPIGSKRRHPKPAAPVYIRGLVDTGASVTGVARWILVKQLGLVPVDSKSFRTPVGPAQVAECFKVRLSFICAGTRHVFADAIVIATDCFEEREEHQALIGRDVLNHCIFQYAGPDKTFTFAF